jgi:hypothetical protein
MFLNVLFLNFFKYNYILFPVRPRSERDHQRVDDQHQSRFESRPEASVSHPQIGGIQRKDESRFCNVIFQTSDLKNELFMKFLFI